MRDPSQRRNKTTCPTCGSAQYSVDVRPAKPTAPVPELPPATEKTIRGYRVRVSYTYTSPEAASARQETLARVLARSLLAGG